jgi:NAD+ kinase
MEIDGHVAELSGMRLSLSWRRDYATLVAFDGAESFFAGLRRRGILADSPRMLARAKRGLTSS